MWAGLWAFMEKLIMYMINNTQFSMLMTIGVKGLMLENSWYAYALQLSLPFNVHVKRTFAQLWTWVK